MGILKGGATLITSEETFVYSEDTDVQPHLPDQLQGAGWIRRDLVRELGIGKGADVVTQRAMDPEERNVSRNLGAKEGPADAALYIVARTVKKVETTDENGKRVKLTKPSEVRAWGRALAQRNWPALDLLAQTGTFLTIGQDVDQLHPVARRLLGYAEPSQESPDGDEEGAEDGGSKSDEPDRAS
ncbi:MAG: hypothetical protein IT385_18985 [Deltaproteobacteria bacterium]|nr:hypothetical protein [Deltaproteobacteria bacterium]